MKKNKTIRLTIILITVVYLILLIFNYRNFTEKLGFIPNVFAVTLIIFSVYYYKKV